MAVVTPPPVAANGLLRIVYGWFVRVERGLYDLTDLGRAALGCWPAPGAAGQPATGP
jgi:hypothetical protein